MGVKSPLALGVAAGGLMLAHAMTAPDADAWKQCTTDSQCDQEAGESACRYTRLIVGSEWVWNQALNMHVLEPIMSRSTTFVDRNTVETPCSLHRG